MYCVYKSIIDKNGYIYFNMIGIYSSLENSIFVAKHEIKNYIYYENYKQGDNLQNLYQPIINKPNSEKYLIGKCCDYYKNTYDIKKVNSVM